MSVKQAYDQWSHQYDTNENKTRDMEARVLRTLLHGKTFKRGLEIGCGTGKNSAVLVGQCEELMAIDFSAGMLEKAKQKPELSAVNFRQADITEKWNFADGKFDLIVFSLVLEHIQNLELIFEKAAKVSDNNALIYVCELHPFKQYAGSKARFETNGETNTVECFTHHISDFTSAATSAGFQIENLGEYFDEGAEMPRLLSLMFRKK